jgi:lipase chaperone LimK
VTGVQTCALPIFAEKQANKRKEVILEAEINRLKQAKDNEAVFALRESYYGTESARRLSALDRKTESLNRRMKEFQKFKQETSEDPALTHDEKMRRIDTALKNNFSEWERPMLRRLDNTPIKRGEQTT